MKHINIPNNYIKRKTSTIDFGYKESEISGYLKPIEDELELLKEAEYKVTHGESTRTVASWLSKESKRYISHVGLWKHMKHTRVASKSFEDGEWWYIRPSGQRERVESHVRKNDKRMFVDSKYISQTHPLYKAGRYKSFDDAAFSSLENYESSTEGEVYIVTNQAWKGWIKIGMAIEAEDRLKNYQTSSPLRDFKLKFKKYFDNRRVAELHAHTLCAKKADKRKGEWFKLDIKIAKDIINNMEVV